MALLLSWMIAGDIFAQGVTDVHSHIITPEFLSALKDEGRLMDEGFPIPQYDAEAHLRWMDEAGVETSVLTLAAPQPTSAEVVRKTNEAAAVLKQKHPGRFLFCADLPLPDVDAAIREAVYALDTLGADGIKLATNAEGQYLGAAELDTLFAVLNRRKAAVMQANGMVGAIDWEKNLAALYYDLAGAHSPEVIRMMLTITAPDHLLYGSDFPYVAPKVLTASLQRMKAYLTSEPDLAPHKEMILRENAERLFGLRRE